MHNDVAEGSLEEPLEEAVNDSSSAGIFRRNLIIGIIWIVFGGVTFFAGDAIQINQGLSSELGPKFWPQMLGILFFITGILLLIQAIRRKVTEPEQEPVTKMGLVEVVGVSVVMILQVVAWATIGFLPATIAALLILPFLLGVRKPIKVVIFSVLTAGLLYGLFAILLRIPL